MGKDIKEKNKMIQHIERTTNFSVFMENGSMVIEMHSIIKLTIDKDKKAKIFVL